MADIQTSATALPTFLPSTSTKYPSYDVFINHRGPDVKDTFASHLYHRLLSHGFQPFLDREVLEKGELLSPQIESAIRTASFHIAIFSPTYADSRWCLDELVSILKTGATIIPLFYSVKPAELRWAGRYAESLKKHEQKGRYDHQTLENWRKALFEVSSIIGFELETYNGDEGKLLDSVVQCLLKKRRQAALNVAKAALYVARYPTGLQEKVEDFEKTVLLQKQQSGEAQVLGIVGLGGVGKSTLAKELFNKKSCDFNKSCFLFDCRETVRQSSICSLQGKLLMGLTQRNEQIDSIDEGIEILRRYLSSSDALVVIDDVDDVHQLDALLPIKDVLQSHSLILVTSRYKDVLTSSGIAESSIYKLTGLDEQYSQQLFCSYAFLQPHPPLGFEYLVDEFCMACGGLPLSLKVFGGLLCQKKDKSYWEGQLDKLRQIKLPTEIQERLKISYNALDGEEKQIFLDIACYFIGEDRDLAIRVWDGSGWNGLVGLLNLESKCLVELDIENNTIKMHDHLRDLGRNIAADQEDSFGRRLWRTTDDIDDLWQQSPVITEVRGIRMVRGLSYFYHIREPESDEEVSWFKNWCDEVFGNCLRKLIDPKPYRFRKLQLVATEDRHLESILRRVESPNLIWLRWNNCPFSCLPPWIPMKNIRVLEVVGIKLKKLWQAESQAPLELRELHVYAPLSMFPKSIGRMKHIEKIVVTCMSDLIHLKTLPEEFCHLSSLQYLHLRCPDMKSLPDSFGFLTNLQHLNLSRCRSLQGLPNSFGNLIRLKYLNLEYCSDLTLSEETFANIRTLEYLNLSDCKSVEVLPRQVAHQLSLEILILSETNLKELPGDIGNLSSLEEFSLGNSLLEMLPGSLGRLSSLKKLWVCDCPELKSLPHSLGLLTQLTTLWVGGCGIQSLPPEVAKLNNLVELRVRECPLRELLLKNLVEGEEGPLTDLSGRREAISDSSAASTQQQCMYRLGHLQLWQTEISQISFGEGVCPNLKQLDIRHCAHLVEIGALPPTLIRLKLYKCRRLRRIEGICNLTRLQKLNIRKCVELEDLPSLERLTALEKFSADECSKLRRIKGLGQLAALRILYVSSCKALEELTGIENLRVLEKLDVAQCPQLRWGEGTVEQLGQRLKFFNL
eukprot:PITA_01263